MWKSIAVLICLICLAALIVPAFQAPGFVRSVDKIDTLSDPIAVTGWDEDGLITSEGQHVPLPGIDKLPTTSEVLSNALSQGIEITDDGRIFALIRVHHWCGNDPVRKHLARVDLAHVLIFMREVEFDFKKQELAESREYDVGVPFSESGWRVGSYYRYLTWSELAASNGI